MHCAGMNEDNWDHNFWNKSIKNTQSRYLLMTALLEYVDTILSSVATTKINVILLMKTCHWLCKNSPYSIFMHIKIWLDFIRIVPFNTEGIKWRPFAEPIAKMRESLR